MGFKHLMGFIDITGQEVSACWLSCGYEGSSGIPLLSPPVCKYLCGRAVLSMAIMVHDVPLYELQKLYNRVCYKAIELPFM